MAKKVLIVDDEKTIVDIISFNLEKDGYEVLCAYDGGEGLRLATEGQPDLVLLDVMLPVMDGFEVCRRIRARSQVPVLMLTAREEEVDKVLGLELGADDYITKPFSMRELMARVKANIRRREADTQPADEKDPGTGEVISIRALTIDQSRYEIRKNGEPLELTLREFELVRFLASQPDRVFSREELMTEVWGYEYFGDLRTVDVTIRRLREKLEDDAAAPKYIMTRRGVGYYFAK